MDKAGSPCHGDRDIFIRRGQAYIRFANIRDASMSYHGIDISSWDWTTIFMSPPEFFQVCRARLLS